MEDIDRELLAGRPPAMAFLPTAAGQEDPTRIEYWLHLGASHAHRLGIEPVPVPVLDRTDAQRADLVQRLGGVGLIYLSGGNPGYLADTLRDTPVLEAIVAAWQEGAALAGCSAGAAALSQVAHDVIAGVARPGLGLVRGVVVIQHFDRMAHWAPRLVERSQASLANGQLLVGIDENTALVGGPWRWRVRGQGTVSLIDAAGGRQCHPPGTK